MKVADIRKSFLEFFRGRDHRVVASSSLVPEDPTAPLLTTAGMVQFIPYLSGKKPVEFPRAASCQKSARTTDVDLVGLDARHQTFFEMLGNFSFGDYFKAEAIAWAWELSLDIFGLEPDRIWATVYEQDDEAAEIWREYLPAERIIRMGKDDNYWWMGVAGPGGPCSELNYDRVGGAETFESGDRIMEYWNLV
ncbi:MAG: alanine--tRNA ligase-related protein, partial [Actinomycetota bacterium]